jgi:protein CpxP
MSTLTRIGVGIGAIALIVGLAAGVYVSAQDVTGPRGPGVGRRGGPGGPGGAMDVLGPMIAARLNLSDAQKDQVKAVVDAHRDELRTLGDRAMETQQSLQAAVTADVVDEGLIRSRAAERGAVEADIAVVRARIHAEVFRILTPEQQAQAKELQANMQKRMEQRQDRRQERQPR